MNDNYNGEFGDGREEFDVDTLNNGMHYGYLVEEREEFEENNIKREIKNKPSKTQTRKMTRRGKNFIKATGSIGATILLILASKNAYNRIEEMKKQFAIDESINEISEEYRKFLTEDPEEIAPQFSKEEREKLQKFFESIRNYEKYKEAKFSTEEEQAFQAAKDYIADYAITEDLKTAAQKTISAKLRNAKLYGDFDYKDKENSEVTYGKDIKNSIFLFTINGVEGEIYEPRAKGPFNNEIPENLEDLAEEVLDYSQYIDSWTESKNGRDKCVKDAIKIGEVLEKAIYESYIIAENGDIIRISDEEFEKRLGNSSSISKDSENSKSNMEETKEIISNDDNEK